MRFVYTVIFMLTALFVTFLHAQEYSTLTVNFSDMTPHIGQTFKLRVVDKYDFRETGRKDTIASQSFQLELKAIEVGHSYFIDFYADLNGNGKYDVPPADHAWRLSLNNVTGNSTINFTHNLNFTDVEFPYLLTIAFTGMSPHLNEQIYIRLENSESLQEMDRIQMTVPSVDFSANIPGIKIGSSYTVEMYADHNRNSKYDSPPVDHAWRFQVDNVQDDTTVTFAHNINFTDVSFPGLLTLDFKAMTPHLGEQMSMRIIESGTSAELIRKTITVPLPDFSVHFPVLEAGKSYKMQMYADHNSNGQYDPPPVDHAWEVPVENVPCDTTVTFTHNVNFTDIMWTDLTGIEGNPETAGSYKLMQNFPNPFNPATNINYTVARNELINLSVFNLLGQKVAVLVNKYQSPGDYSVRFDGKNLISGIYFYRLRAGNFTTSRKMVLLR